MKTLIISKTLVLFNEYPDYRLLFYVKMVDMTDGNTGCISGSSMLGVENRDGKRIIGDLRESNRKSGIGAENGENRWIFGNGR